METFLADDGRRLAYEDSGGDGPAVLCLAGLTRNSRDFSDLAAHLAPRYRVLRLDSRGRGGSEHASDAISEYTVPVEAHDALTLIKKLGLRRVALIGTSRGGILSMAIAGGDHDLASCVVLNDVGAVIEGPGLLRILATMGRPPTATSFADAARDLAELHGRAFPGVPMSQWERFARQIYDERDGRPALSYDTHLKAAAARAVDIGEGGVSLWPLFDALKTIPVLVIRGENSDILSAGTVEMMRAHHPDLEALTLKNRGHAPFLNEPEALAAIDAFLAKATLETAA